MASEPLYGFATSRQILQTSPSFIERHRPDWGATLFTTSHTPYVTQLISTTDSVLLSYADDGFFRYHDKSSLKVHSQVKWDKGGDCTSLLSTQQGYMATGRNGLIGYWDSRQDREQTCLAGPSRAPYLSLASKEHVVAAGTELQGVDVTVDIWDLRQPSIPVFTYVETHSDDVTSLSFHKDVPHILLSASSDSLLAVSDIRKADEDDSVLGVINTGASIARAGWGGSSIHRAKALIDEDEKDMSRLDEPSLGAFYSVSDMQTVGIWEADGWEELLSARDVRQAELIITPEWSTEFVIDAKADSRVLSTRDSIGIFCGNQDGSAALIEIPNQEGNNWTMHCRLSGGHSEVVRSVYWDLDNSCVFTGAEDGLICGWRLSGHSNGHQESATSISVISRPVTGALKEERTRPAYRPY